MYEDNCPRDQTPPIAFNPEVRPDVISWGNRRDVKVAERLDCGRLRRPLGRPVPWVRAGATRSPLGLSALLPPGTCAPPASSALGQSFMWACIAAGNQYHVVDSSSVEDFSASVTQDARDACAAAVERLAALWTNMPSDPYNWFNSSILAGARHWRQAQAGRMKMRRARVCSCWAAPRARRYVDRRAEDAAGSTLRTKSCTTWPQRRHVRSFRRADVSCTC